MQSLSSLLPFGLALIMAQVGMALTVGDFRRLKDEPRAVLVGLAIQMGAPPLLAFALLQVVSVPPEFALGMMLIAASPGGVTSNLMTLIAGGDVALAVTITAVTTLASAGSLPLLLAVAANSIGEGLPNFDMPIWLMARGLLITTILPLAAGMAARYFAPRIIVRIEPSFRRASVAIFLAMALATFIGNATAFRSHGLTLGPAMLALDVAAMGVAVALASVCRLALRQAIAIGFEAGLHNAAVAIVVALSVLGRPELAVAPVIYAFTMNLGAIAFIPIARRWLSSRRATARVSRATA